MIGHYLLTLTSEQEDRVLTKRLAPGKPSSTAPLCLMQCVMGAKDGNNVPGGWSEWSPLGPVFVGGTPTFLEWGDAQPLPMLYDSLYHRFGERLNNAIRNRILANRARRTLLTSRETAVELVSL